MAGDFAIAFRHMAEDAVKRDVDALIVSGDFFNKAVVDPLTLLDAQEVLKYLKESEIEVIVVEGNHDTSIYSHEMSWLHFLSHQGLLKLLQIRYPDGKADLRPWNEESKKGAFVDVEGVRFYGLGYLGASSSKKLGLLQEAIEPADFTVAMLHAGVDMFNDMDMGGVSTADVNLLREKVDYVALGHVHGRYSVDDWMYNPGGLENWRPEECIKKKGYFLVDVGGGSAKVEAMDSIRRPGFVIDANVAGQNTDGEVSALIRTKVETTEIDPASAPIVCVKLSGKAGFDLMRLDIAAMREWIMSETGAVECLINDRTSFDSVGVGTRGPSPRGEVEREIFGELIKGTEIASMSQEQKVDLVLRYKNLALSQELAKPERAQCIRDLIRETISVKKVA